MLTSTSSIPTGSTGGTITRAIARLDNLVRLFQLDATMDVVRALPVDDMRRDVLLKYWGVQRDQLARLTPPEVA